jgi:hypothetical protein
MSRRTQENIIAFVFLFFFIWIFVMSFNYSPKARFVPIPVVTVSIVILLVQMYLMNFKRNINLNVDAAELLTRGKSSEAMEKVHETGEAKPPKKKRDNESGALMMIFIYLVMNLLIGVLPATFFFMFGFFVRITKISWLKSFLYTASTLAFIWLFFVYILSIRFYEGWVINLFLG